MKFEPFTGKDGQHYFRMVGGNGETVATSEGHKRKGTVKKTIKSIESALAGISGWYGLRFNGEVIAYCKFENDLLDMEGSYLGQEGEIERFEVKEK